MSKKRCRQASSIYHEHFQLAVECVTAMALFIVLKQNLVLIERNVRRYSNWINNALRYRIV